MTLRGLGVRFDPVQAYNFLVSFQSAAGSSGRVSLDAVAAGGFSEVGGLETNLEVEEYKEGGRNDFVHKLPTRVTWGNLRLKRGVALSDELWNWYSGFLEGRGERRDGLITLLNDERKPVRAWSVRRAMPIKWTGPMLNALRSEVAVEELEVAHEGLRLESSNTLMGVGELVDVAADLVGF